MAESIDSETKIKPLCPSWYDGFVADMKNLQQQKRLPHAILLSLPKDNDEMPFLWYFSMSLLCQDSVEGRPCRQCASCTQMLANTYPDFKPVGLEYDDSKKKYHKNIRIEQVRELIHEVYITRSYDNLKIAVIYPADRMSIAGANSLLKTLEEPAENALIIIATHSPGKVPVTIRSRCQQWTLQLPAIEEATSWLENQGLDNQQAVQYLNLSNANPGLALKLFQSDYLQVVSEFKQKFAQYLKNQIDVVMLGQFLAAHKIDLARRLIAMVVEAYCFQYCGFNESSTNKTAARSMLELMSQIESQLTIEENNLDLQLQLIDVLISIKQIIIKSQQPIRSRE
ncbi:MAG: DNA polymerase III subunit delta' [Gammaproteobacteria bacterium]|nr:DNA polymerase III subunit delta' [Gammaproteobacteria bacterium]